MLLLSLERTKERKIVNALLMINPVLVGQTLRESLMEMDAETFAQKLTEMVRRADHFAKCDDTALVASLNDADSVEYASHCASFFKHLQTLKEDMASGFGQRLVAISFAYTCAWWQVINHFRNMHGASVQ